MDVPEKERYVRSYPMVKGSAQKKKCRPGQLWRALTFSRIYPRPASPWHMPEKIPASASGRLYYTTPYLFSLLSVAWTTGSGGSDNRPATLLVSSPGVYILPPVPMKASSVSDTIQRIYPASLSTQPIWLQKLSDARYGLLVCVQTSLYVFSIRASWVDFEPLNGKSC